MKSFHCLIIMEHNVVYVYGRRINLWFRRFEWGQRIYIGKGSEQNGMYRWMPISIYVDCRDFSFFFHSFSVCRISGGNIRGCRDKRIKIVSRPLFAFWKYYFIYFSAILMSESYRLFENWSKNLLMSTRENFTFFLGKILFSSSVVFDLELHSGKRFIRFSGGLIYVERKWVGFVKHLKRWIRIRKAFFCASSFSYYYFSSLGGWYGYYCCIIYGSRRTSLCRLYRMNRIP